MFGIASKSLPSRNLDDVTVSGPFWLWQLAYRLTRIFAISSQTYFENFAQAHGFGDRLVMKGDWHMAGKLGKEGQRIDGVTFCAF